MRLTGRVEPPYPRLAFGAGALGGGGLKIGNMETDGPQRGESEPASGRERDVAASVPGGDSELNDGVLGDGVLSGDTLGALEADAAEVGALEVDALEVDALRVEVGSGRHDVPGTTERNSGIPADRVVSARRPGSSGSGSGSASGSGSVSGSSGPGPNASGPASGLGVEGSGSSGGSRVGALWGRLRRIGGLSSGSGGGPADSSAHPHDSGAHPHDAGGSRGRGGGSGGGAAFGPGGSDPNGRRHRDAWSGRKKLFVWGCTALACIIVMVTAGFAVVWGHLNGNIRTEGADLKPSSMDGKQDVLFIGSDSRANAADQALGGGTVVGARSDTTMIFDSPADRRKGTEVSIPRDSMVQIPDCTGAHGQRIASSFAMFNSAFTTGGAPCTVRTVESLTGLQLTHYIVVDFEGVVGVVNALGGVKVCVTQPIKDPDSGLNIPAGTTTLNGQQALAFVRVRHTLGDGSDLERIQRQQYFIDQLSAQVRADGLLSDPIKLYKVLDAATRSIQTDPGLGSLSDLYGLAQTLNSIPTGKMTYVTVPNEPYSGDPDRVSWSEPAATTLWKSLIKESDSATASSTQAALGLGAGLDRAGLARDSGRESDHEPVPVSRPVASPAIGPSAVLPAGSNSGPGRGSRVQPIDPPRPQDRAVLHQDLQQLLGPAALRGPWAPGVTSNVASEETRAVESLGVFESLMRLAFMADTPSDTRAVTGPSGTSGAWHGSGIASVTGTGTDTGTGDAGTTSASDVSGASGASSVTAGDAGSSGAAAGLATGAATPGGVGTCPVS